MNTIIRYIKDFFGKEFSWPYFLFILLMISWIIYLNYWHGLEKKYAAGGSGWLRHFTGYYLQYFVPFALAFLLQPLFFKNCSYLTNGWFWAILILAPAFFSFRVNFNFHHSLIYKNWQGPELKFYFSTINWVVRVFVLLIPVFVIWWLKDRTNQPFYGSRSLNSIKPYLIMLLIMVPILALASTQNDFLKTYPKAQIINAIPATTWQGKLKYLVYELCYGFDFAFLPAGIF